MKKTMVLAAILALVMAVSPAMAQELSLEIGQESESEEVSIEGSVSSSGNYAQQCVAPLQFGNSGNLQSGQGAVQYLTDSDDIEFEGSSFSFSPSVSTSCDQAVQQSAAASG